MPPSPFDARAARHYADGPPRQVPGFAGIHRMMNLLLAETVANDSQPFSSSAPAAALNSRPWRTSAPAGAPALDPSADMLQLSPAEITAEHAPRIDLTEGYIDAAPEGPF